MKINDLGFDNLNSCCKPLERPSKEQPTAARNDKDNMLQATGTAQQRTGSATGYSGRGAPPGGLPRLRDGARLFCPRMRRHQQGG